MRLAARLLGGLPSGRISTVSAVAGAFGLGFAALVPAYVVAIRELLPAIEASWRVPTLLLFKGSEMATGSWLAGAIYDHFGFYDAAFATGILFNAANLAIIGTTALRRNRCGGRIRLRSRLPS